MTGESTYSNESNNAIPENELGLRRTLGRWQLMSVGIGAIVGAGIFVIPGPAAAQFAGPAIVLSFIIAAVGCALAGLCYAELATMYPHAGSAYAYGSRAFGPFFGWLIGWLLVLEYLFAAAIVSQGFATYALGMFNVADTKGVGGEMSALIGLLMFMVAWLAVRGVELSARVVVVTVLIKLGVIVLVIAFGLFFIDPGNWTPFIPTNTGHWGEFGWSGVFRAAGIIFYVYLGFDMVSVSAAEARAPQRDVPFALIGSLVVCTVLFILMMVIVTGLVDFRALNVANPVAVAIDAAGPSLRWLKPVVEIGAMIGMASVLLVVLMSGARILFAMANDGLLPSALARLHPEWRTPGTATILSAVLAAVLASFVPIGVLGQMVSIGVLSAFISVAVIVLVWRAKMPDADRPFRTPWVPAVPIGAILVCAYMMIGLPAMTWLQFALWLALGILIYVGYGRYSRNRTV
jgi:APA family basic amino acid/polyamine antiporter